MAVALRDYYPKLKTKATIGLVLYNLGLTTVIYGLYLVLSLDSVLGSNLGFLASLGAFVALQLFLLPFVLSWLFEPVKLITDAITHVSKQENDVVPPNINDARHEKSGLRDVIQTIYELAVGSTHEVDVATGNSANLPQNETFLKNLLNELPCGVIAMNHTRQIVYANQSAPVVVNSDQEQLLQLQFEGDESLDQWLAMCEKDKLRETKIWTRVPNKLPDEPGQQIFDVIAHYEKGGKASDTILVTVDRTSDYAPAQEEMDFTAVAAHELRGPITVIRGYLDVLSTDLKGTLNADQQALFDRINVSSNRLSTYINNILNASRFDRKHMTLHLREARLEDIFKHLMDDLDMRAKTQNRILTINLPPDLPTIAADNNSIGEVISNLVDNAIKYSNEGGQVIVTAGVKGDEVEVTIQDFGVGIATSIMDHLFTKFYRSHHTNTSVSGTGLGLYLCKGVVESHGGHIWARSIEGQGSTFGFTLPIYSTVADKLAKSDNKNENIIKSSGGWIKNHSMFGG